MIMAIIAILSGVLVLLWSADKFIEGAASLADSLGVSTLVIGMVVVGFGTSAPEMIVSAFAAYDGNPQLALGNAYGSNIVNIGLVLGVTALLAPIRVKSGLLRKELPLLVIIVILSLILLFDQNLSRAESVLLLVLFFTLILWTTYYSKNAQNDSIESDFAELLDEKKVDRKKALLWLVIGLLLMLVSSRLFVWGAVEIARFLQVSELIIGLTIVALGTSLPELAASIIAIKRNEHDLAVGNVVGSNMFNLLAVIGIAGVIHPTEISMNMLTRDWPIMTLLTVLLFISAIGRGGEGKINRWEGLVLLLTYLGYSGYLIVSA